MIGAWGDIEELQAANADLVTISLPAEFKQVLQAPGKAPQAVICLALVVGLMVSGLIANVQTP